MMIPRMQAEPMNPPPQMGPGLTPETQMLRAPVPQMQQATMVPQQPTPLPRGPAPMGGITQRPQAPAPQPGAVPMGAARPRSGKNMRPGAAPSPFRSMR